MEKRTSIDGSRPSLDKQDPPAAQSQQPQDSNSPPQSLVDLTKFGLPEEENLVTCKCITKQIEGGVFFYLKIIKK